MIKGPLLHLLQSYEICKMKYPTVCRRRGTAAMGIGSGRVPRRSEQPKTRALFRRGVLAHSGDYK